MQGSALFESRPVYKPSVVSIKDALDLPAFNAMYQANALTTSANHCNDEVTKQMFMHNVVNNVIVCGGSKPVELDFFEKAFGVNTRSVDTKEVWNIYDTEADYNIYFEAEAAGATPGAAFNATLLRANHAKGGKYSYPEAGFSILDKENNVWYSVELVNKNADYGHVVTLKPQTNVIGSVKKYKKYLVFPARFVGGFSCPLPTNAMPTVGYMQKVNPFRLRRDWHVKIDLLRGYTDKLRWTIIFDKDGKEIDAWDAYEADKARQDLQLARNILGFFATPITNADLINGTNVTMVDDVHTGFYGYLPSVKNGGGNVLDYDPSMGYNLQSDLEPFILSQEALKQSTTYTIRHGKAFKARMIDSANRMVRINGLGANVFPAFQRNGGALQKMEFDSYEYLGFKLIFQEWGALSDSRLLGGQYFENMAIATPIDGVKDRQGNTIPTIESFQYGMNGQTGDYYENMVDFRNTTLCEELKGSVMQSVMMVTHCPHKHILFNPIQTC